MTTWDAHRAQSLALATQIAMLMPGSRAVPPEREYGWARVIREDGSGFFLRMGNRSWGDGRVVVSPIWPTYADGRQYSAPYRYRAVEFHPATRGIVPGWQVRHPTEPGETTWSISVAAGRAPAAIAREIARRLLPAYETMYAAAVEEVHGTNLDTDEAELVGNRLAGILGGHVRPRERKTAERVEISTPHTGLSRLYVTPAWRDDYPASVRFEADLDPETAAKVFAVIADAQRERERLEIDRRVATPDGEFAEVDEDQGLDEEVRRMRVGAGQ